MDAGSGHVVYVYFQNPTYPRDFPRTDFSIFDIIVGGVNAVQI